MVTGDEQQRRAQGDRGQRPGDSGGGRQRPDPQRLPVLKQAPGHTSLRLALAIAVLLAFFVAQFVGQELFAISAHASGVALHVFQNENSTFTLWAVICGDALVILTVLILRHRYRRARAGLIYEHRSTLRTVCNALPVLALTAGIPFAATVAGGEFGSLWPGTWQRLVSVIVFVAVVGLAEELLFRGAMIDVLGGAARPALAVIGAGVIFGGAHLLSPDFTIARALNAIGVFGAFGLPFAMIRLRGGSIVGLAIVHALNDLYAALTLNGVDIDKSSASLAGGIFYGVAGVILVCGYFLWLRTSKGRWKPPPAHALNASAIS